jgi:hypothetical protein
VCIVWLIQTRVVVEMAWLFLMVLSPAFASLVFAFVWWLIWGRKAGLPVGRVSAFSLAAGLVLFVGGVSMRLLTGPLQLLLDVPIEFWEWYRDYGFTSPLLLGILGLVLVAMPVRARTGRGAADLTPRTAVSFARGWWFVTPAVVFALILTATFAAGIASEPDEVGRYTMYSVEIGGGRGMGVSIYGWFHSVPCLILLGLMIAIASLDLVLISRPALDPNQAKDVHVRTIRTCNVLLIGTGALLLHLGLIFDSLAGTASLRSSFPTSEGTVMFWTTFAALEPVLRGASSVAAAFGFALWAAVALSAIPPKRLAPATARL